jgi:hypothetical protein
LGCPEDGRDDHASDTEKRCDGGVLISLFGLDRARLVGAAEETKLAHSKRGRILVAAEGYRFEVFFYRSGVRVFLLDNAGNAVDTSRLTASATFYHSSAPEEPWFSRPLEPDPTDTDDKPSSLVLRIGLAKVPEKATIVAFEIIGLYGPTASTATFRIPLEFVAKAAAPDAEISAEPRPIVSPGNDGSLANVVSGPSPPPGPAQAAPTYLGTPINTGGNTSMNLTTTGLMRGDWTTGRSNLPLSRPWLPPKR